MNTTENEIRTKENVGFTEAEAAIKKPSVAGEINYFSMHRKDWGDDQYVYWYNDGHIDHPGNFMMRAAGAYSEYEPTQADKEAFDWILSE